MAANVARIRDAQRLTYVDLSKRLTDLGRPIAVLGLRRIERGERRVDADDLLALAVALGVPPVDLVIPADLADDAPYNVTPTDTAPAGRVREWIGGQDFLVEPNGPLELAEALRPLDKERAAVLNRKWWTSDDRESMYIRATNRWHDPLADDGVIS